MAPGALTTLMGALGLGEEHGPWLERLEAVGPAPTPTVLPAGSAAEDDLGRLGLGGADVAEVLANRPDPLGSPELWWLLDRCRAEIVARMGDDVGEYLWWPQLPAALGAPGRCFYIHVYLATLADTRDWHRSHGVPDEASWRVLADLARHVAIFRRVHGSTGVDAPSWLTLHLRGLLYECGRLQYNLFRVTDRSPRHWYNRTGPDRPEPGFRRGDQLIGVHIPEGGPLSPEACAASRAEAAAFFAEHFPARGPRVATCSSWLLDDQLAGYLPADSNIVRFQRLFELVPGWTEDDGSIIEFVFRRYGAVDLDGLPQRTALERAVVAHLRAGGHWRVRTGWLEL